MTESSRISGELHRAFFSSPWHGPALAEILDGVSAGIAAARPIAGAHSIWELVLHLHAWAVEAAATTRGKSYESVKGERDWPPVIDTSPEAWRLALDQLKLAEVELETAVKGLPEAHLEGGEASYYLLHGIAQHYAYHGGQIQLLKKAAASGPRETESTS